MGFELVDGYLLGEPVSKASVVEEFLREPVDDPVAAPFYRALEAVGVRAADEAFIALRLVLAGKAPSDAAVRRVRALSAVARACARGDGRGLGVALERDRATLADLPFVAGGPDPATLGPAANVAYRAEMRDERNVHPD